MAITRVYFSYVDSHSLCASDLLSALAKTNYTKHPFVSRLSTNLYLSMDTIRPLIVSLHLLNFSHNCFIARMNSRNTQYSIAHLPKISILGSIVHTTQDFVSFETA